MRWVSASAGCGSDMHDGANALMASREIFDGVESPLAIVLLIGYLALHALPRLR